ncbi:NmrA family NAD(P)-binding protein [Salipaludibacillus daqingensis]|uniref:NmrA family NAD(P)-binding protein n=1 Tax=Salipaludibacillus daqingensis TaxID=3041001 RepID=UPI0024747350|nr:NmrA family NAD(P)-binding protein [Salipaludibacillus daqingensis]
MGKIFVTGATGNIGRHVVEQLVNKGEDTVAGSWHASKRTRISDHHEEVPFDFLNENTFDEALIGVDRIFLVRPPQLAKPKRDMVPFLNKVSAMNIKNLVFISLLGVEKNPIAPHKKIEKMIEEFDIPHTFLRPSFFMQNLSTTHRDDIALRDEIAVPVGKATTSFIDTRDIGEAAAICLQDADEHVNNIYTLTGEDAITYETVASTLSRVLGRQITYRDLGFLAFRKEQIALGVKKEFANVMTMLYAITKMGNAKKVTNDLEVLLKRKPTSFRQFVIDHQSKWSPLVELEKKAK